MLTLGLTACTTSPPKVPPSFEATPPASVPSPHPPEVETHLLHAVQAAEKLGPGNPFLLTSLYSLAAYYRDQGEWTKAESIYKKALSVKESSSGTEHPDIAIILDHYAMILKRNNRQAEAIPLEARARAIRAKTRHKPSPPSSSLSH